MDSERIKWELIISTKPAVEMRILLYSVVVTDYTHASGGLRIWVPWSEDLCGTSKLSMYTNIFATLTKIDD